MTTYILSNYYAPPQNPEFDFTSATYDPTNVPVTALAFSFYSPLTVALPPPYDPSTVFQNNPTVSSLLTSPSYQTPTPDATHSGLVFDFLDNLYAAPTGDLQFVFKSNRTAWGPLVRIFFL